MHVDQKRKHLKLFTSMPEELHFESSHPHEAFNSSNNFQFKTLEYTGYILFLNEWTNYMIDFGK